MLLVVVGGGVGRGRPAVGRRAMDFAAVLQSLRGGKEEKVQVNLPDTIVLSPGEEDGRDRVPTVQQVSAGRAGGGGGGDGNDSWGCY